MGLAPCNLLIQIIICFDEVPGSISKNLYWCPILIIEIVKFVSLVILKSDFDNSLTIRTTTF